MACSPYNFRFIQDDPLKIIRVLWPGTKFSREQEEILYSVWFNYETGVRAANMMGKDYVASFAVVAGFLTRWPCKIITTSAGGGHLVVLWGEIHNRINTSKIPLSVERGGPLFINQMEIGATYELNPKKDRDLGSYILGRVASDETMAGMGGHHVPRSKDWLWRTMCVGDEASGIKETLVDTVKGWCHRLFLFGNTWDCNNPFRWAFEGKPGTEDRGGDVLAPDGITYTRKVYSLPVETSPNIRYARAQILGGKEPTDEMIVEGIKSWGKYQQELADPSWDDKQRCIKHRAEWWKGKDVMLFPMEWLDRAERVADDLSKGKGEWDHEKARWSAEGPYRASRSRTARAIGVDPAEGGDKTSMVAVDEWGVIEVFSKKTPNTADITGLAIAFLRKHNVPPSMVAFDAGGGGQQHADRLRMQGFPVRTIRFGAAVQPVIKRSKRMFDERVEVAEDKYVYLNLRAQMYHELSQLLDPDLNPKGFGIPRVYGNLRSELAPIPKDTDEEGRYFLRPKNRPTTDLQTGKKVPTLVELIGHSPDEADALVLAIYAMNHKMKPTTAGVLV